MITDQEIETAKEDLKRALSVFPDAQVSVDTPDRSEEYKKGYVDKLKAGGIKCEVWRVYIKL